MSTRSTGLWASEVDQYKPQYRDQVRKMEAKDQKRREAAVEAAARLQQDKAKQAELNARIEGLTGEPAHLIVHNDSVIGFTVLDLEAILRKVEDGILGI